jgi:5-methylcytosine-specific restriction endonuclease McrA
MCDCGNIKNIPTGNLQQGITRSCGCLSKETASRLMTKHGLYKNVSYRNGYSKRHKEKRRNLDSAWTPFHEFALKQFDPFCAICRISNIQHILQYGTALSVDHVLPLSKGYGLEPGNAVLLCTFHNSSKYNRNLEDLPPMWAQAILYQAERFRLAWAGGF